MADIETQNRGQRTIVSNIRVNCSLTRVFSDPEYYRGRTCLTIGNHLIMSKIQGDISA